jgi:c-di-GMP-binding flagellar brake protein YcgR
MGKKMDEPKKPQKRNFVRLNVVLPVKYRKYSGNPVFEGVFNVGRTYDLSSGGMKLTVSKPLLAGEKLDIELELGENTKPYIIGQVLGGEDVMIEGIARRVEKINFIDVDSEAQEMIMKYIFDFQRKEFRKDKKNSQE